MKDPQLCFHFGTERTTSHPDESYFGQYRTHFFGNYRLLTAFRFAVRSSLALDFQDDLGISFQIPKRENVSGAHFNFVDAENKEFDIYSIPNEEQFSENAFFIAKDLFDVGTGEKQNFDEKTTYFLELLFKFFEKYSSNRKKTYSLVKGSDIFPRIALNQLNDTNENDYNEEEEEDNDEREEEDDDEREENDDDEREEEEDDEREENDGNEREEEEDDEREENDDNEREEEEDDEREEEEDNEREENDDNEREENEDDEREEEEDDERDDDDDKEYNSDDNN